MSESIPLPQRKCPVTQRTTRTLSVKIEVYPTYDAIYWHCAACGSWHCEKRIRQTVEVPG